LEGEGPAGAKARAVEAIDERSELLRSLNERIYRNPEPGHREHKAMAWLCEALEEEGFSVRRGVAGMRTAFQARWGEGRPAVAILAEYDALPGLGHGCGHNFIAAAAVGAAVGVRRAGLRGPGSVVVLGCPAEEGAVPGAGGKVVLVGAGAFRDIDCAMMVHPSTRTVVEVSSTARAALSISFTGKASDPAESPELGVNALEGLIQTFNAFNALRQYLPEGARIHGIITEGGASPQVVPDYAEARVYVRARDSAGLARLYERVKCCAEGAALAIGSEVNVEHYARTYDALITNRALAGVFRANLESLSVEVGAPAIGAGSTDMGNVSSVVPAVHPYVQVGGVSAPVHTRAFGDATVSRDGHAALLIAAKALAMTAIDVLSDPVLRRRMKAEFEEARRGAAPGPKPNRPFVR